MAKARKQLQLLQRNKTCLLSHGSALSRNRFAQSQLTDTFLCLYSQRCNRNAGSITHTHIYPRPLYAPHPHTHTHSRCADNGVFAHKFDICTYVFAAAAQILRIRRVHQKNITHTPCGRVLIVCMGVVGKIIAVRVHKKKRTRF